MEPPPAFSPWFEELSLHTPNAYWGALTVNLLARWGLEYAVLSPGSRSTPLTYAFARNPHIEAIPVLDERSAGFFALGLAKRTGKPVVLVCTSGTAVANYYPAVIEARYSHTPLFLLTADRPHELRHCHSGQTIDQVGIYGNYSTFEAEADFPDLTLEAAERHAGLLRQAWEAATGNEAGPAHINFPFRDPLHPNASADSFVLEFDLTTVFQKLPPPAPDETMHPKLPEGNNARGLILVGSAHPPDPLLFCQGIAGLAHHYGWPVLTDALNPLRNYKELNPYLISGYDTSLLNEEVAENGIPDQVLQIGSLPTSKRLRAWLKKHSIPTWVLDPSQDNRDPLQRPVKKIQSRVEAFAGLAQSKKAPSAWTQSWIDFENNFAEKCRETFRTEERLFEGKIPRLLAEHLPPETPVFIANSMPVRDAEYFWPLNDRHYSIFTNRGANGIDGTLSTALGVAHQGRPTVLLTGDLALLHDTNGFLLADQFSGSLTIILIQNGGGAIFDNLPIHEERTTFQQYFRTPQRVALPDLCSAYGVTYQKVNAWKSLEEVLEVVGRESGVRVVEICTDPEKDVPYRKSLHRTLSQSLSFTSENHHELDPS